MRVLDDTGPFVFEIDQPPHPVRWVVAPSDLPQCVGRTRQGRRCKNKVMETFDGSLNVYRTSVWTRSGVLVLYPIRGEPDALRLWLEQRCYAHDTPEAVEECAVEWRPFSPELDTERFVRPIPDLPSWPEPTDSWEEVPQWMVELWDIARFQRSRGLTTGARYSQGEGWTSTPR